MKENVLEFLKNNNIPFEEITHKEVFTMEDLQREGVDKKCTLCKNLFLRDAKGKTHFLVSALNETEIDLRRLADVIGSTKLSFASDKRIDKYLKSYQGCISPFGVINDEEKEVIVVLDEGFKGKDKLGFHPNENTSTVVISFENLKKFLDLNGNDYYIKKL